MSFRIGEFEFINLSRAISRPMQRLEREVRPGVNGVTYWRMGVRSAPFQLVSVVDTPTVEGGLAMLAAYETLVGADPVAATWASLVLPDLRVVVSDVQPLDDGLHAMLFGIGGVTQTVSRGLLRAAWTVESLDPFFD